MTVFEFTNFVLTNAGVQYTQYQSSTGRRAVSSNNYGGTCVASESPNPLKLVYDLPTEVCTLNFWSGPVTCDQTYSGYIDPKYVVVGVTYAPPGPSSYVQYTNGTTLATTKSTSKSFSDGETISTSSVFTAIKGFAGGKVTITNSNTATQASTNSTSVTLSLSSQIASKTPGTPNAHSPINHDYDIIWLWLNPVANYAVTPALSSAPQWQGYGYDTTDQPALDIWPVYVGYLDGDFGALDAEDAKVLARTWAGSQTWPSGQGPGLTQTDFEQILQADPFSNKAYAVVLASGSQPPTTTDGRYTISSNAGTAAQSFTYKQASAGEPPIVQSLQNGYSTSSTLGESDTTTTQETFGVDVSFTASIFIAKLTEDIKYSQTLICKRSACTGYTRDV